MSPTIDPSKLKVSELREELQTRGLDTKGNKPVLVKRLKKALEEELNKELPDTSIADTSTEDLDSSRVEESSKNEAEVESESESKSVPDQKDVDVSSQMTIEVPSDSSINVNTSDRNENIDEKEEVPKSESNDTKEVQDIQEKQVECLETNDVMMKEVSADVEHNQKGEKRKRSDDSSEQVQKKRPFKVTEDEPDIDSSKVLLSWYDSDLHLIVDKQSFLSAKPLHEGLFGYAWAGVRATHGINSGKVRYEVKLTEEMSWEDFTNQRRERQERAKERREKEKQRIKSSSDKHDTGEKDSKTEEQDIEEKPEDVKMEVSEEKESNEKAEDTNMEVSDEKPSGVENPTDISDKNQTDETEESKIGTEETKIKPEESIEPSPGEENQNMESESKADESKKLSEDKEESETKNEEKKENSEDLENSKKKCEDSSTPILTHIFRTGWSIDKSSLQLGEDDFSYGYESTGKFVSNKEFNDFAKSYKLGDVVGAYLNISNDNVEMRFTINGELQSEVKVIPRSQFPQENFVLFPHILSRNFSFELNLGSKEEPWFPCPEGLEDYAFLQAVEDKIQGPVRPEKKEECEVIMMCGLPGSGKTHWVNEYLKSNNEKLTNVIGATHLLERMTVHGQPLKSTYNGQWNMLMEKLQRCLNRLGDIAAQRRRNYILDQTNVFPSAQLRKLRAFEGFKRRAVVVVVGDEEFAKRQSLKEAAVGKDVHEYTIMEMKANMALPTKGDLFDEVIYSDLNEEEAKAKVSQYNTEGKTAINQKKRFRDDKGRFFNRAPYNRGGNFRDRGPPRYDRGPRGWGQLPPPGRNPRDRRPPPPPVSGGRDWMRNSRGPPRPPVHDRNVRDSRPMNFNRNRNQGGRSNNWQSGGNSYSQGGWSGQQGNWGSANQGWGSGYQQQGNWNANGQNQWKYGGGNNQGYNQQGYGQNWNNYYGQQYPQNWSGQYS